MLTWSEQHCVFSVQYHGPLTALDWEHCWLRKTSWLLVLLQPHKSTGAVDLCCFGILLLWSLKINLTGVTSWRREGSEWKLVDVQLRLRTLDTTKIRLPGLQFWIKKCAGGRRAMSWPPGLLLPSAQTLRTSSVCEYSRFLVVVFFLDFLLK